MAINIKAFLALEASLSHRLSTALKKGMKKLYAEVEGHLRRGDYDKAVNGACKYFCVNRLSSTYREGTEKYIDYVSHLSCFTVAR